jgi:hypothetical protein
MCGAPVREGRVTAVITARTLLGRLGLLRPSLALICLAVRSSQVHEGDDLTNYGAFGPFVRSFILLVDPGDICPPQYRQRPFLRLMPRVVITPKLLSVYLMKMKRKKKKSR